MVNITKKVLEDEVKLLNKRNIKLIYMDKVYNLLYNNAVIFTGNAKETYIYLQGLKYGLYVLTGKSDKNSEAFEEFGAYDYFKNRVEKGFIIEAKKTAQDTYFSQFKNKYYINIERLTPDFMYFTAKMDLLTPNGYRSGETLHIPMRTIKLEEKDSIDKIGEKILRSINVAVLEMVKRDDTLRGERLLWITKDDLWYLGWSNNGMLTKKVDFKVI